MNAELELFATRRAASGSPPACWCGKGGIVTVGTYQLCDPMVYFSEGTPAEDEASCIELSLEVGKPVWEAGNAFGYYPTYAKISPNHAANYLSWLSNGRTGPSTDIGYAFLFFYGLERRLIVERQDLSPIVKECVRLLETYTFSGSFDGYLSRFLAFTMAQSRNRNAQRQMVRGHIREVATQQGRRLPRGRIGVVLPEERPSARHLGNANRRQDPARREASSSTVFRTSSIRSSKSAIAKNSATA